jgi:hypothetical protein
LPTILLMSSSLYISFLVKSSNPIELLTGLTSPFSSQVAPTGFLRCEFNGLITPLHSRLLGYSFIFPLNHMEPSRPIFYHFSFFRPNSGLFYFTRFCCSCSFVHHCLESSF